MEENRDYVFPNPLLNQKELDSLDILTEKYNKLIQPSKVAKLGTKILDFVPNKVKNFGAQVGTTISEQEMFEQMMKIIATGFKVVEEQAARFSVSEKSILNQITHNFPNYKVGHMEEMCLIRSYDLSKLVSRYKSKDLFSALIEGGGTGAFGFWGLPFNLVLSTFIYFRAVQSIAMYYGYDTKNDNRELVIASEVFTMSLSPSKEDINNGLTTTIGKIMLMSQAAVVKQTAKKTWTDMAARGGIPLLLTQMRALANKAAQRALEKAGQKGLENSVFREAFEQIGRKITLKTVGKTVPIASAVIGALIDTAQMNVVLEFADIFYQKRFILEKEKRINYLLNAGTSKENSAVLDDVIDIADFQEV